MHISGGAQRARLTAGAILGVAVVGGGVLLSQVAQADQASPGATPSASASSAPASPKVTAATAKPTTVASVAPTAASSAPTPTTTASTAPTAPPSLAVASSSATPAAGASTLPSATPSASDLVRAECFVTDADIQARYPGAGASTTTTVGGTQKIWTVGGSYVGQTMNGRGITVKCPTS